METNDTLTIQPPTPLAFVLANGDSSQSTKTSQAHLQRRIYGDNSATRITVISGATGTNTVNWCNLFVTIFATPYLDSLVNAYKSQTSNVFHHCNAIPKPAAPYFANTAPYPAAHRDKSMLTTGTINRMDCAG